MDTPLNKTSVREASPYKNQPITVLIPSLDAVKPKNLHQFGELGQRGYQFIIFTPDATGHSREIASTAVGMEVHLAPRRWSRCWHLTQLLRVLLTRKIHLVELYPYSFLQLMLAALVKVARIPLMIVARGEEYWYVTNKMPRPRKIAFRLTYRLADAVIYKESYMQAFLKELGKQRIYQLPNAIVVPPSPNPFVPQRCHFLYMNSMKFFRHPETVVKAFIEICQELRLDTQSPIRLFVVGFLGVSAPPDVVEKEAELRALLAEKNLPIEYHPWSNTPEQWLERTDVFLLPADIVFLNYTLLEAMGRAIPAIIQNAENAELIITHEHDGFLAPNEPSAWKQYMLTCIRNPSWRKECGQAARQKVMERFSIEAYLERYDRIYRELIG